MRLLLLLACLAAAASATSSSPEPELKPPPLPPQQVASKRLGFASLENPFEKIARWFFPNSDSGHSPGRAIGRTPTFVHGPPRHAPPSAPSGPQHISSYGPPRPKLQLPPPPQKCNPCNKVPWVPIPHAQYQDGGNVFAVVNAPQLHQGLHGNSQPSVPVYHHSPLPQGYLPTFNNNNDNNYNGNNDNNYNGNNDNNYNGNNNNHAASEHVSVEHHHNNAGGFPASDSGTEIVQSIPIAQYTSSIQYPIDVIQSPIIDVGGSGASGSGGEFKSLKNEEINHNVNIHNNNNNHQIADNHNNIVPENYQPTNINAAIGHNGVATSYQNVNLHAENSVQQETHHIPSANDIAITPSVQTSVDLSHEFKPHVQDSNVQVVYPNNPEGTVLPPIPTQQQPPAEQPPPPFQITTFQQPPSAHAPAVFHSGPSGGFAVSGPQRLIPPSAFGPHQSGQFLSIPTFQQPPQRFPSAGQINVLRQIPTASGLSPPPPPPQPPHNHPYRFELVPPSGNAINQQVLGTASPVLDYTPWQPTAGVPTDSPPSAAAAINVATLTQSGNHAVSTQNNNLDSEASGLRSQWHHREINHQLQESRVVNVTAAPELETSTNVHILASDLRAILREEQQRLREQQKLQQLEYQQKQQQNQNPNLIRLQHNIDEWTEKEFSHTDFNNLVLTDDKHKLTTATATLIPSKHIPQEYFPTSPAYSASTIRPPSFFDHEPAASIAHNVHAKVTGTKVNTFKVNVPEYETTVTTEVPTTYTTTEEPTSTSAEPRRTTWEQALLGYSSTSREKVYVVTPMSTHQWAEKVSVTTPRYVSTSTTPAPTSTSTPTPTTEYKTTKGFVIRGRGAIKHQQTSSTTHSVSVHTSTSQSTSSSSPAPITTISADATAFRSPRFTVRPTPGPRESPSSTASTLAANSRGNRYYTVPAPTSYNTARVSQLEKRSTTHETDETTVPSVTSSTTSTPQPEHSSPQEHSKVITVVSSSSSSSAPVHNKKATRLTVKPAKTITPSNQSTRDEEVSAAVQEVGSLDLKRKTT